MLSAISNACLAVATIALLLSGQGVWAEAATTMTRDYSENLLLQPLPPGELLASFNFKGRTPVSAYRQQHFRYFPRSLGQVLQHAHTSELHLRFSTGRWNPEAWGAMPWNGTKEGGTGVELWAWVDADSEEEAFARWRTLNNALSGLFCASMNFIDETHTSRPVLTFEPAGDHTEEAMDRLYLLHGTLPHEVVCTENLTPFIKQLPCKGKAGIASLLDGHKVFDSSWQTMSIDIRPVCEASGGVGGECQMEIDQTIDMVLDIDRSRRPRNDPIPRPISRDDLECANKTYDNPNACYPIDMTITRHFSLNEMFGRRLHGTCLGHVGAGHEEAEPTVCINAPNERNIYATERVKEYKFPSGDRRCMIIPDGEDTDLFFASEGTEFNLPLSPPPLYAERSMTGYGQERGGLSTTLRNPSNTSSAEFIYFETLPWYMKAYLHTRRIQVNGSYVPSSHVVRDTYYRPGQDRERGTQLEMRLEVPAASTVTLTYDFDKAILRYTEYPPDANRGFDVAPAVIRILPQRGSKDTEDAFALTNGAFLRTTSLLLPLPTPDFSMPYNVIILTSTVIALAFGSVFTILTRRFVAADEVPSSGWQAALRARIARLKGAATKEGQEKKTQ